MYILNGVCLKEGSRKNERAKYMLSRENQGNREKAFIRKRSERKEE